jgi:hypothetical protein
VVYKIPVDELRELVKKCRSVRGGDGRRSQMYLLSMKGLKKYIVQPIGSTPVKTEADEEEEKAVNLKVDDGDDEDDEEDIIDKLLRMTINEA